MKIMPFFLPVISFGLPAGLVVYFLVSNLWRVGQQAFITRTLYANAGVPAIVETTATVTVSDTPTKSRPTRAVGQTTSTTDVAAPARSAMGRNRREDLPIKSARLPEPAKPKAASPAPTATRRVTPAGSSMSARPAKKKKRK